MKIDKITHGKWGNAYACEVGSVRLIVVAEIGPRIISLSVNGSENFLYEDQSDFSYGDWHIYGGHRFTTAPETADTYLPDNESCEVETAGGRIVISSKINSNNIQKILEIDEFDGDFAIRHTLRNSGDMLYSCGPWSITCVKPEGRLVTPWGSGSANWRTNMIRYWSVSGGNRANLRSSQWQPGNDTFVVKPTGETGKVGLFSDKGWIALLREDGTFVKHCEPVGNEASYPDGGCNVEIYTCDKFLEMELLGPLEIIYPGAEIVHTEHWRLTTETFSPDEWKNIITFGD